MIWINVTLTFFLLELRVILNSYYCKSTSGICLSDLAEEDSLATSSQAESFIPNIPPNTTFGYTQFQASSSPTKPFTAIGLPPPIHPIITRYAQCIRNNAYLHYRNYPIPLSRFPFAARSFHHRCPLPSCTYATPRRDVTSSPYCMNDPL